MATKLEPGAAMVPVGIRMTADDLARLDAYIARQRFATSRTAICNIALIEFLDREERDRKGAKK